VFFLFIEENILIEKLKKRKQNHCCNHPQGTHQRKTGKSFNRKKKEKKIGTLEIIKYVNNSHIKIIKLYHRAVEILSHD
jgi:hypothetical protein